MNDDLQLAQHPDADQLSAFAEDALSPREREHTLAHLAQCTRCREIVNLSLPPQEIVELTPAAAPQHGLASWFLGWRLLFPATAALAATAFIVLHVHQPPRAPAQMQVAEQRPVSPIASDVVGRSNPAPPVAAPSRPAALSERRSPIQLSPPAPLVSSNAVVTAEGQSFNNLPLQNRNLQNLPSARPQGGPRAQQNSNFARLAQGASGAVQPPPLEPRPYSFTPAAPAPAPPGAAPGADAKTINGSLAAGSAMAQQPAVAVASAAAEMSTEDAIVEAPLTVKRSVLPSGAGAASMVTRGSRTLALDAAGILFASEDGGSTWKVVRTPWQGRAVRLEPVSFVLRSEVDGNASSEARLRAAPARPGAELSGTVRDPSGAVIPGATLSLTVPGRAAVSTSADPQGRYTISASAGTTAVLEINAPGFTRQTIQVMLDKAEPKVRDVTLNVGQVSESVTVTTETKAMPALRAKKKGPSPAPFQVVTDRGERWSSIDGLVWTPAR